LLIFPKTQIYETHGRIGGNDHKSFNTVSFFSYRFSMLVLMEMKQIWQA